MPEDSADDGIAEVGGSRPKPEGADGSVAARPCDIDFLLAWLVGEPFCVPFDQLGKVTLRGIGTIYGWSRTKDGQLIPPEGEDGGREDNEEAIFRSVWKDRKATPEQIDALWTAHVRHRLLKHGKALQMGIVGIMGEVFDGKRMAELDEEFVVAWREIAKSIMEPGDGGKL